MQTFDNKSMLKIVHWVGFLIIEDIGKVNRSIRCSNFLYYKVFCLLPDSRRKAENSFPSRCHIKGLRFYAFQTKHSKQFPLSVTTFDMSEHKLISACFHETLPIKAVMIECDQ